MSYGETQNVINKYIHTYVRHTYVCMHNVQNQIINGITFISLLVIHCQNLHCLTVKIFSGFLLLKKPKESFITFPDVLDFCCGIGSVSVS